MKTRQYLVIIPALILIFGCLFQSDKVSGRGTVVDNEVLTGKIMLADGKAAINARVRIYRVNHIPDSLALAKTGGSKNFSTFTDSNGRYRLTISEKGEYNILGELKGQLSYLGSIYLNDSTRDIPSDTLSLPGIVKGVIGMQPNHPTRTAIVQVLGTNIYANVSEEGHFELATMAPGVYSARIVTTLPDYSPLIFSLTVNPGETNQLKDTIWLPYTGMPTVTGLKATYDTLRGVVNLSWNPVKYQFLEGYLVYRNVEPSLTFPGTHIGSQVETSFSDTLGRSIGLQQNDTNDSLLSKMF